MQIKRLLNDGELVVTMDNGRSAQVKPEQLGCYVIQVNRTDRGLA